MRTIRTNFDRQEARRDRRYSLPLLVTFGGAQYTSNNWSLGGFQVTSDHAFDIGAMVDGTLQIDGKESLAFSALLVRKDSESGTLGFQFKELGPGAVEKLDRALARRLVGRKQP